ncbi:DUF7847 domain-containing protein [Halorussus litoreus]|uniref:DUF7847 domain-containing protein n=1 Tax=Halorussus litoreus TaxID=1710536 RepID=UPI0013007DBE|nr:hypothetical protein [Halorussus litoreus]
MGAISALSTAVQTLKRNTVLFAATFLVVLVNFAISGAMYALPPSTAGLASVPLSWASMLLTPFLMGGLLAMADEGLGGRTRLGTFLDGGRANYLRLLASMVLFGILLAVIGFAAVVGFAVLAVFTVGMSATGAAGSVTASSGSLVVLGVFAFVAAVVTFLPMFFLQFYGAAVVVSDLGPVDSFKRSSGLVRRNLLSTLGYSAVTIVVGGTVGVVAGVASLVASLSFQSEQFSGTELPLPELSLGAVAAAAIVAVVLTTVVSAFASVYQVAFYEDVLERTQLGEDDPAVDAT